MFRRRRSKHRMFAGIITVAVVVAAAAGILLIRHNLDLTRYKDEIAAYVTETTGREFQIEGRIDASLGFSPSISARNISLGNAPWGKAAKMVQVEHLTAAFSLWPLIFGTFEIKRLTLSGGQINLETSDRGIGNWEIRNAEAVIDEGDEYIDFRYQSFESAQLENMKVAYRDEKTGAEGSGYIGALAIDVTGPESDVVVSFDGAVENQRWRLEGHTGALRDLSLGRPVKIGVQGNIGKSTFSVDGQANDLLGFAGVDIKLDAKGLGLADFFELTGIKPPEFGPFVMSATLSNTTKNRYDFSLQLTLTENDAVLSVQGKVDDILRFENFAGTIRASASETARLGPIIGVRIPNVGAFTLTANLSGSATELKANNFSLEVGQNNTQGSATWRYGTVPKITLTLTSAVVDVTPFATIQDRDDAKLEPKRSSEGDLFWGQKLPFDTLHTIDMDISVNINQLIIRGAKIDLFHTKIDLSKGMLRIEPLEIDYRNATATARLAIALEKQPRTTLSLLIQDFNLGQLLSETQVTDKVKGDIDVGIHVTGQGFSVKEIVAGLNGRASIVMGKGEISSSYIDLIAVDLTKFLIPWRKGVNEASIKCALIQFEITEGVAKTSSLLFDTREMTMSGKGSINLETEKIDFLLSPRPKDPSLFSLATNLRVGGTLLKPEVAPDALSVVGEIAEGVAAVLLLGPAGLLVPFASLGAGHHHPCVDDLQKTFGNKITAQSEQQPN